MRCHEENSDRKAEAFVKADGELCDEYDEQICDDGAIASFIPIIAGQKIVVEGVFRGTTKKVFFDLFVDGVLRNSHSQMSNLTRKGRRAVKFNAGFYFDKANKTLTEGTMLTEELDLEMVSFETPGKDTVGLIEVHISISRYKDEPERQLEEKSNFEAMTNWKERFPNPSYTTSAPTYHIILPNVEPQPSKAAIGALRGRVNASRPGLRPWAVMRFYYRGKGEPYSTYTNLRLRTLADMINEAGYLTLPSSKAGHCLNLPEIPPGHSEIGESDDDDGTFAEPMIRASTHEDLKAGNEFPAAAEEAVESGGEATPHAQGLQSPVEAAGANSMPALHEPSSSLFGSNRSSYNSATVAEPGEDQIVKAEATRPSFQENGVARGATARGKKRTNSEAPERASKRVKDEYLEFTINLIRQRRRELQKLRERRMQAEREAEDERVGALLKDHGEKLANSIAGPPTGSTSEGVTRS